MTALSSPAASPPLQRSAPRLSASPLEAAERNNLLLQAQELDRQARLSAEMGDLDTAARLILQGLDCERRAGGLGPQVLQLIKPR
ncbi:MAG: hypothetical protein VKP70_01165 [Cyanobacteriota bacterium]|nr:hypothetical protein [Cyanobacteriota bacterium]